MRGTATYEAGSLPWRCAAGEAGAIRRSALFTSDVVDVVWLRRRSGSDRGGEDANGIRMNM